jgi:hypothetical protein
MITIIGEDRWYEIDKENRKIVVRIKRRGGKVRKIVEKTLIVDRVIIEPGVFKELNVKLESGGKIVAEFSVPCL